MGKADMMSAMRDQGGISEIRQRPARTALALAIALMTLVIAGQAVRAQTFSVLYSFTGKHGDVSPAGLVRNSAGNFYGTSSSGGGGAGTVVEIALRKDGEWKETVLYSFAGAPDAAFPEGTLVLDAAGTLYGTSVGGGIPNAGTVYKLTKTGKETVLYSFCSVANCADGAFPNGGLVRDAAGNLYGTTSLGGNAGECCGTVFKVDPAGNETVLYSFCSVANCADGSFPIGGGNFFLNETLVRDAAGNLYGTTPNGGGGLGCGDLGCGTVFKVDPTGKETVLYSFCSVANCTDGSHPGVGLIQDAAGNLYGTTTDGGEHLHYGTVFKVDPNGQETVLHSFPGHASGEVYPSALVLDAAGNLYGTTEVGGNLHQGSVFEVTASGRKRTLYSFKAGTDGGLPFGLVEDAAGNLYGTTGLGGNLDDCNGSGCGTFFELTPN